MTNSPEGYHDMEGKGKSADGGGKNELSRREKRIRSFEDSIPFIDQIEFSYGGFLYGYEKRKIIISEENVSLHVDYIWHFSEDQKPFVRNFPGMKKYFLEAFASLHIGKWEDNYCNYQVLDGDSWDLAISFSKDHRVVKKSGSNAYPDNFDEFYDLMKLEENDDFLEAYYEQN